jgi:hypothetical protein
VPMSSVASCSVVAGNLSSTLLRLDVVAISISHCRSLPFETPNTNKCTCSIMAPPLSWRAACARSAAMSAANRRPAVARERGRVEGQLVHKVLPTRRDWVPDKLSQD